MSGNSQEIEAKPSAPVGHKTDLGAPDQVVLIHGTGASADEDHGGAWWQTGSEAQRIFSEGLSRVAMMAGPFRWSGANSERARQAAGKELLERLLTYEAGGTPYHLVGHSHGGSVIWAMLKRATTASIDLEHLKSWTTLGTPFFEYWPIKFNLLRSIPLIVTLFALLPFGGSVDPGQHVLPTIILTTFLERFHDIEEVGEYILFVVVPILTLLWLIAFGWSVTHCLRFALAQAGAASDRKFADQVYRKYGARYLGIWSRSDEAINGLQSSLSLGGVLTPRITRETTSLTGRVWWSLQWPFRTLYNDFVARSADEFAWETISLRLQGSDLGGVELVSVNRVPNRQFRGWPQLPKEIDEELSALADLHAAATLKAVRDSLGPGSTVGGNPNVVANMLSRITFQELVHNSYYRKSEILDLTMHHIMATATHPQNFAMPAEHLTWYNSGHQATVGRAVEKDAILPRGTKLSLTVMRSLVATALCLGAWLGLLTVYRGSLWPLRDEYQVQSIIGEAPRLVPAVYASDSALWLRAMTALGPNDQALKQARNAKGVLRPERGPISALMVVASTMRIKGDEAAARVPEHEAVRRALAISDEYERAQASGELAVYFASVGIVEESLLAPAAQGRFRAEAVNNVAETLAEAGHPAAADRLMSTLGAEFTSSSIDAYLRAGQVDEALKIAMKELASGRPLRSGSTSFMRALVRAGRVDLALEAANKAKISSSPGSDTFASDGAHAALSLALAEAGRLREAVAAASEVVNWSSPDGASTARILARGGLRDEARTIALKSVAAILADNNYWWSAQSLIRRSADLREAGAQAETDSALDELLAACRRKYDGNFVNDFEVLGRAVFTLIEVGDARRAVEHASLFQGGTARATYLSIASVALENAGLTTEAENALAQAIETSDNIVGDESRSKACAEIAGALARERRYRAARLPAMSCLRSEDKLRAFALVVLERVYEENPSWRAKLATLPKIR